MTWPKVLDDLIGPRSAFLCGDDIALPDYFNMKALNSSAKVNEALCK